MARSTSHANSRPSLMHVAAWLGDWWWYSVRRRRIWIEGMQHCVRTSVIANYRSTIHHSVFSVFILIYFDIDLFWFILSVQKALSESRQCWVLVHAIAFTATGRTGRPASPTVWESKAAAEVWNLKLQMAGRLAPKRSAGFSNSCFCCSVTKLFIINHIALAV